MKLVVNYEFHASQAPYFRPYDFEKIMLVATKSKNFTSY